VRHALLVLVFALGAGLAAPVPAQIPLPKFEALVTDLTGTLTAQQQAALDEKLTQFEARKGSQIAVLMLPSTAPEDIAQFGIRLAEEWKVGRKNADDGVILIVAKDDRAMRIEVGRGLEGAVPDALAGRIVYETIAPLFRQGDYYGGINAGLDQLIRVIDGEPLPAPDQRWKPAERGKVSWPFVIIFFVLLGNILSRFFGRFLGSAISGLLGAGIVWWFTSMLVIAAASFVGFLILGLLIGSGAFSGIDPGGRRGRRVFRDYGRGGGFGGFGGGFGRGGGFGGGGGGSFGGGGASGRW